LISEGRIPLELASAIEGTASCRSGSGARLDVRTADPAQVERGNERLDDADEVGFGDEVAQGTPEASSVG